MQIYQHYKGGLYGIVCHAYLESTDEEMVVYFSIDNSKHWIRPLKEFNEKFKKFTKPA